MSIITCSDPTKIILATSTWSQVEVLKLVLSLSTAQVAYKYKYESTTSLATPALQMRTFKVAYVTGVYDWSAPDA